MSLPSRLAAAPAFGRRSSTKRTDTSRIRPHHLRGAALIRRYVLLVGCLILLVGPLVVPLLGAFKGQGEEMFGPQATVFPKHWSVDAFEQLFARTHIVQYVTNSLIICALAVTSHVVLACTGGYMLSRQGWRGRRFVTLVVVSAMIFPFEAIMVSLYTSVNRLGLLDTLIGVWLPGMLGPFHLLLMRASFLGVPGELEDAALLDGANEWQRFFQVMLPQAKGAVVVVGLTSFIYAWQDFLWPLLIIHSDSKFTMMMGIAKLQGAFGFDYRLVLAGAIAALVPILVVFFFSQKYFFRGIEEGGLKF